MNNSKKKTDFHRKTELLLKRSSNGRIGVRQFESVLPILATKIRMDVGSSAFSFWGNSFNVDENEGEVIVDPKILNVIGRLAHCPVRQGKQYHAGLIHTYGYLLSNLKTQYGFKRKRWTNGNIEKALGLLPGTLIGRHDESTLFQNVTYLVGRIAWDNKDRIKQVNSLNHVSDKLRKIRFEELSVERIEEKVSTRRGSKPLHLYTDLVKLRSGSPIDALLVYSIRESGKQKLVTCFSAGLPMIKELVKSAKANETPVQPRFNVAIGNFAKPGKPGTRRVFARRPLKLK